MKAHVRSDPARRLTLSASLAAMLLVAGPVGAAEGEGCAAAAWSLAADGERLSAVSAPRSSGSTLVLGEPTALVMSLTPAAQTRLPVAPGRTAAADTFSGHVLLQLPEAGGIVQVTLAQAAWIDLVRDGVALVPVAFTGVQNCALARKSVRFRVPAGGGSWVLQVSGAPMDRLAVAVSWDP